MKKNLLFAAMAVAALASCSNEDIIEVNKGNGISFRTSLDKAVTRANAIDRQNMDAFNVTAIGNGASYFTNLSVTSSDKGASWTTDATYYWPGYELEFFAYAPQSFNNIVKIDNTTKKITGFSPAKAVAKQKDLVISYNKGTKADSDAGVAMNFKHALSQIQVQAKCSNANMKVEVLGVKLVNAATEADFAFPEVETATDYTLPQNRWSDWKGANDHSKAYMIKGNDFVTLTNTAKSIMFGDDNFMLIPQQLTKWDGASATNGAYLSVLCRIYNQGNNGTGTLVFPQPTSTDPKDGKYAFSAVGIDTNWEPGKKYIYTLNFFGNGGGAGQIDPNKSNPSIPDDKDVDIDPIPGGTDGGSILGAPIKFTVTVDNWVDQTENVNI